MPRLPALTKICFSLASAALLLTAGLTLPAHAAVTPKVQAGQDFIMALKDDGTVWTWGGNGYGGTLGDGSTEWNRPQPGLVPGLNGVIDVAAGGYHALALTSDGRVWAWGYNSNGQLGLGDSQDRGTPVQVPGLTGITAVAAGDSHSLALKSDGTVWAWGANSQGQLGDGSQTDRSSAVPVTGLASVSKIAAGGYHSLALTEARTVWSWGHNSFGQLGDGGNFDRATAAQIPDLANISAIGAGWKHSLALATDHTVWAWGLNGNGQLGDGTTSERYSPVQVPNLANISAIASGGAGGPIFSLAVDSSGTVWGWGSNYFGQLGRERTAMETALSPVALTGVSGINDVVTGAETSLAVHGDGSVWAWGLNSSGQLGDGSTDDRHTPAKIANFSLLSNASAASDDDRVFNYLEAIYPQFLAPANAPSHTLSPYYYRFYSDSVAYVGSAAGELYYLGPATGNQLFRLGTVAEWLARATAAGY